MNRGTHILPFPPTGAQDRALPVGDVALAHAVRRWRTAKAELALIALVDPLRSSVRDPAAAACAALSPLAAGLPRSGAI